MLSAVLLPTRIPEPTMLGPAKPRRLDQPIAVSLAMLPQSSETLTIVPSPLSAPTAGEAT